MEWQWNEQGQEKYKKIIVWLLTLVAFTVPLFPLIGPVLIFIAICIAALRMSKKKKWEIKKSPGQWLILGFVVLSFASIFNSPIIDFSFLNWIYEVGSYVSLYYLTLTYIDKYEDRRRLLFAMIISAILVCLYGLFQYAFLSGLGNKEWVDPERFPLIRRRFYSTLQNPNLLGAYLMEVLAISAPLAILHHRVRRPWVGWLIALFFIVCTVLTYSRGIWISLAMMLLYWGLVVNRKLLWSFTVVPFILFFYHGGVAARLWSLLGQRDTSISLRYALWDSTTYMIADYPFLGIGWGAYWVVYPYYNYFIQDSETVIYHAHNMYLHIAATVGLPGAVLLFSFFIFLAWKAFRIETGNKTAELVIKYGLTALIIGTFVSGLTDYELFSYQTSIVFWQILGLGAGIIYDHEQNNTSL